MSESAAVAAAVEILATEWGIFVQRIGENAWCVKSREGDEYCIDVMRMAYNYRLVLSPKAPIAHHTWDCGYCYFGHGENASGGQRTMATAAAAAFLAAGSWSGQGDPDGFDKRLGPTPA